MPGACGTAAPQPAVRAEMRGHFHDPALRAETRDHWTYTVVPALMLEETEPLRPLLRRERDLVALDVGANKGFWAAAFLRGFPGQVRHVFMVEPCPENYRELTRRDDDLMLSKAEQRLVSAHLYAMGEAPGSVILYTDDDGSPLASLDPHADNGYAHPKLRAVTLHREIRVLVDTVDDFVSRQSIGRIDVLKLDVEGSEWAALQGGARTLGAGLVDCVTFEFGLHQVHARRFFIDYWQFFRAIGFAMFVASEGQAVPIEHYEYRYEVFADNVMLMAVRP